LLDHIFKDIMAKAFVCEYLHTYLFESVSSVF